MRSGHLAWQRMLHQIGWSMRPAATASTSSSESIEVDQPKEEAVIEKALAASVLQRASLRARPKAVVILLARPRRRIVRRGVAIPPRGEPHASTLNLTTSRTQRVVSGSSGCERQFFRALLPWLGRFRVFPQGLSQCPCLLLLSCQAPPLTAYGSDTIENLRCGGSRLQ